MRKVWSALVLVLVLVLVLGAGLLVAAGSWSGVGGSQGGGETAKVGPFPVASDGAGKDAPTGTASTNGAGGPGWCPPLDPAAESGADGHSFIARFTGVPAAPLSACGALGWDVQVHSRDPVTWYALETMQAQHGADCGAPPASHENHTYEGAVFQCKDHVMTAINASGYGVIYLTPPEMVDFATQGTISFDVSTERMSGRDWIDVWVTPYADNLTLPFNTGEVDLQGNPRTGLHFNMGNGQSAWTIETISNYVGTELFPAYAGVPFNEGIVAGTNQAATRQPFKITLTRTHVKMERLATASGAYKLFMDRDIPDIGFSQGVVQFGHHSYTPTKDAAGVPATWHWDNIAVSPSVPFSIQRAQQRYVDEANPVMTFAAPAPEGGMLRFAGIGTITMSFDGGSTWVAAQKQPGSDPSAGHLASYWTPIPQGVQSLKIKFAPDGSYTGPYIAKDFAIWALK